MKNPDPRFGLDKIYIAGECPVSNDFQLTEEIADLECGRLRPIRAVNRIPLNVGPELFPDRAGIGFGRIGRAHDFAEFVDRVIRFKNHQNDRPFSHEFHKAREKRPLFVHVIETLGLCLGKMKHLHRADSKSLLFESADDGTGVSRLQGIRFENGECFHHEYALIASPISAGLFTTRIPAASIAFIFSAAVPLPPATIAPACPIRRPGGAVCPQMKPTTGFFTLALMYAAASSSAVPPISPIMTMPRVSGSSLKSLMASMKLVPMIGSPPIPMQVDWPIFRFVSWPTASYVSVPLREITPTVPSR